MLSFATPLQIGGVVLYWAVVCFTLAITAAVVGARGVAESSVELERIVVLIVVILAVIVLLL
ncbi:DUF1328 domain-containing protein [Natrinema sp. HArc-T2]|uniref:DUF1328 domain-containing protein n=1 Tax=Natrinema sp. HArc-T2 TaxID=3242701 RepID=UPI00359D7176